MTGSKSQPSLLISDRSDLNLISFEAMSFNFSLQMFVSCARCTDEMIAQKKNLLLKKCFLCTSLSNRGVVLILDGSCYLVKQSLSKTFIFDRQLVFA